MCFAGKMSALTAPKSEPDGLPPATGSSVSISPKRNKRKSHEPKRVAATDTTPVVRPRKIKFEDSAATSDGEERNNSPRGESSSPDSCKSTPPAQVMAMPHPKKRFKHDPSLLEMDFSSSSDDHHHVKAEQPMSPPTTPSPNRNNNNNITSGKIHRPWDNKEVAAAKADAEPPTSPTDPVVRGGGDPTGYLVALMQQIQQGLVTQDPASLLQLQVLFAQQQAYAAAAAAAAAADSWQRASVPGPSPPASEPEQDEPLALIKKPTKPASVAPPATPTKKSVSKASKASSAPKQPTSSSTSRNYKNMTRERRVEANARERQRVHTITAAFDTLHSLIPSPENVGKSPASSDSQPCVKDLLFGGLTETAAANASASPNNQCKLSKLSIIKIATSYIMLLSRMAGYDYTEDKSAPSIEECVKNCSRLLTSETKSSKKKD